MREKLENLKKQLRAHGRVAVCYSGGVDSVFLARIAVDSLGGDNVLGLLADTPAMPRAEIESARRAAVSIGLRLMEVRTFEVDDPVYVSNPVNRCYYCKKIIYSALIATAGERGFDIVLDGNNSDDADDYRPGHTAAVELEVESPLMNAGLSKLEIRSLSRELGLESADKPALACLATRVPAHTPISRELLAKIERAEQIAWDAGFTQLRLRDHGDCACLEIAERDFFLISDSETREAMVKGVIACGYKRVTLNLTPLFRE